MTLLLGAIGCDVQLIRYCADFPGPRFDIEATIGHGSLFGKEIRHQSGSFTGLHKPTEMILVGPTGRTAD